MFYFSVFDWFLFREFAFTIYLMTDAPKEVKLKKLFVLIDEDGSQSLSSQEVVKAVKHAYDVLGKLNHDYNKKGLEIFRYEYARTHVCSPELNAYLSNGQQLHSTKVDEM